MTSKPHFPLRATFLALPLEDEASKQYVQTQEILQEYENILSFQNPRSPHLTLTYWPEIMEIEYFQIIKQAEKIASKTRRFRINVTGVDTFVHRGEDRVLFLSVAFSDELARIKKSCPWPSIKPFSPHITLARIQHPQRFHRVKKQLMKKLRNISFCISFDRLRLYAELQGLKQTPLLDFPFQNYAVTS